MPEDDETIIGGETVIDQPPPAAAPELVIGAEEVRPAAAAPPVRRARGGGGLGLKEYTALAVLVVAAAVAFLLFNDNDGDSTPRFDSPHKPLVGEGEWRLTYLAVTASDDVEVGGTTVPVLDQDYVEPPDLELVPRLWKLRADVNLNVAPGRYFVRIRYNGDAKVLQDGKQLLANSTSVTNELLFPLDVPAGGTNVRIELRDTGSPVSVHWSLAAGAGVKK